MNFSRWLSVALLLTGMIILGHQSLAAWGTSPEHSLSPLSPEMDMETRTDHPILASGTPAGVLLVNGNFEEVPFYWRVPNHWIAGGWYRWWSESTPTMPEFDDIRPWSPRPYDGNHAQVYFKWGQPYEAGIYQEVSGLIPCTPYRLTMWARNDSNDVILPHARIGLDPQGTQLTSRTPLGPEDEDSVVRGGMPPLTVWSPEQTARFTWEQLSVEAEPLGNKLTVILYARPEPLGNAVYFTTFWDAGQLITSTFAGNRLPPPMDLTPSEFITNVTITTVLDRLVVEWDTLAPASTQVWYDILSPTVPVTPTGPYVVYLPLVMRSISYAYATPLDINPVTHHRAVISDLEDGQIVRLLLLSRHPTATQCQTEIYGPVEITLTIPPITQTYLPLMLRHFRP